jgi:hypothetical protein
VNAGERVLGAVLIGRGGADGDKVGFELRFNGAGQFGNQIVGKRCFQNQ